MVGQFIDLCSNASDDSVTSKLWLVKDKKAGYILAAFELLFVTVGLPWNLLVMATIIRKKLFKQPTILLLLNLVVSDLILLLVLIPMHVWTGIRGEYSIGNSDMVRCQTCLIGLLFTMFGLLSLFTVFLMSFDRFLFIYKPLKYDRIMTPLRTLLALGIVWLVSIVVSLLPVFGYGNLIFTPGSLSCTFDFSVEFSYYSLIVGAVSFVPILFIIIFNVWVVVIVQRNIRAVYKVKRSLSVTPNGQMDELMEHMRKKCHEKQWHLIKMFGALLCSNMVTWLPFVSYTRFHKHC